MLRLPSPEDIERYKALLSDEKRKCDHPDCPETSKHLWMCLFPGCSFVGCGRAHNRHALQHFTNTCLLDEHANLPALLPRPLPSSPVNPNPMLPLVKIAPIPEASRPIVLRPAGVPRPRGAAAAAAQHRGLFGYVEGEEEEEEEEEEEFFIASAEFPGAVVDGRGGEGED